MVSLRSLTSRLFLAASVILPLTSASTYVSPSLDLRAGTSTGATLCHTVNVQAPINLQACLLGGTILGETLTQLLGIVTCSSPLTSAAAVVDVADSICLCVAAGVLTPSSILALQAAISANGTGVDILTSDIGGTIGYTADSLLSYIESVEPSILGSYSTTCNYPANSVPNSCSVCTWTCASGYTQCNGGCIATGTTCPTQRRRRLDYTVDPDLRCPKGKSACLIPKTGPWNGDNFECIDTSQDIESCGGCANPLPERPEGIDCTSIPNAQSVSCQNSQCVVNECDSGFQSNGTACITNQEAAALLSDQVLLGRRSIPPADKQPRSAPQAGAEPWRGGMGMYIGTPKEKESKFWEHLQVKTQDLRQGKKGRGSSRRDFNKMQGKR